MHLEDLLEAVEGIAEEATSTISPMPEPLFSTFCLDAMKPSEVQRLVSHPQVSNDLSYVRRTLDAVLLTQQGVFQEMKGIVLNLTSNGSG